jgi:ferric-dicitrate binding protein FerR (iron transport regulator)
MESSRRTEAESVREAAEWFVELRADEPSPALLAAFAEWLRRSPLHVKQYLSVAAGWESLPSRGFSQSYISDLLSRLRERETNTVVEFAPAPTGCKTEVP